MKTSPFHLQLKMDIIENKTRKEKKCCNRFFGLIFLNGGVYMSSSIKLVYVIMHSHYSLTEVSHLEKQSPCLQSSPPISNPIDILRGLNELEDKKSTVLYLFFFF